MMWRGTWVLVVVLLAGCTKKNEQKYCTEQTCTTPDFPFCDVTGFASGEAGTCIAVSCTPGEFGECRGDQEVRCNPAGTNYDVVQCERGCDASADGCRLCDPNETACTNGRVATCDAGGTVVSSFACALGCFEDQPRCRQLNPSNGLGAYLDMVETPPDIDLKNAFINTRAGTIEELPSGPLLNVPSFLVPAAAGGAPIRVFVAGNVRIADAQVGTNEAANVPGPAFALVARGDIDIVGTLRVGGHAGFVAFQGCSGGHGRLRPNCTYSGAGGGGGGFGTPGAKGGDVINNSAPGGFAGATSGSPTLVPLRGGCPGGGTTDEQGNPPSDYSTPGGGAVQLGSLTKIEIAGTVDVRGAHGYVDYLQPAGWEVDGGGAGGAILLEAPVVELGPDAKLLATGGSGGSCPMVMNCGVGGQGASATTLPVVGADVSCPADQTTATGGGGGGGLGRLRVNTHDGIYTKSNTTVEDANASSGVVQTR
jgi:hypothetical protein